MHIYTYIQCYSSFNTLIHPLHFTLGDWFPITSHCRFSGEGTRGLSHYRGVLQRWEVGGRQGCQLAKKTQSWIYTSTPIMSKHTCCLQVSCTAALHFTLHLSSLPVAQNNNTNTSNHTPLVVSNQLRVEGTSRQSWFSHGVPVMVRVNEVH